VPPDHLSLDYYVFTMNKNIEQRLFHSVSKEMAVDRGTLPSPFKASEGGQCVNAGIQSELQNTTEKSLLREWQNAHIPNLVPNDLS
jgi:hypothetical protein